MVRPEDRVFQDKRWPKEVQRDFKNGQMDKYYQRAYDMLGVSSYPKEIPKMGKIELFEKACRAAGMESKLSRPDLAVTFEATAANKFGVPQAAAHFSGHLNTGNASGAKNDTTKNYLADALKQRTEIFCGIDVQWIKENPDNGGYTVFFIDSSNPDSGEMAVSAKTVVLSAGALGTSGILLRSKEKKLLDLNDNIGKRFNGNGATVAYIAGGEKEEKVLVNAGDTQDITKPVGVFIDSLLDCRDKNAKNLEDNVVIEDCCWSSRIPLELCSVDWPKDVGELIKLCQNLMSDESSTLPLMILGHDDADAELVLAGEGVDRHVTIKWNSVEKENKSREAQHKIIKALADGLGGTFKKLPPGVRSLSKRITAHPLGGCVMSDNPSNGVVDCDCKVYRMDGSTHSGLMIVDGSFMPTSLGCNPALTITALSERALENHVRDAGKRFSVTTLGRSILAKSLMRAMKRTHEPEVTFTERMAGHLGIEGVFAQDTTNGTGIDENSPIEFNVKVSIDDLAAFKAHDEDASAVGTAMAPSLSPHPLTITNGKVRLFVESKESILVRQMHYELPMQAYNGRRFILRGHKDMSDEHDLNCFGASCQMYSDTTRLTAVVREEGVKGKTMGIGLLNISFFDCLKMIFSIKGPKATQFKTYFVGSTAKIYLRAWLPKRTPAITDDLLPLQRSLKAPQMRIYTLKTEDNEELTVKRFKGGTKGVVLCTHGLTTTDLMYTLETVPANFVETKTEQGYDVWAANLRFSRVTNPKNVDYDLDDVARYDYPALFDFIEEETDPSSRKGGIHVYGQCFGGHTFSMAVLGGHIAPKRVKSIVFCQLGMNVRFSPMNSAKMAFKIPQALYKLGVHSYHNCRDPRRGFTDKFLDWAASYIIPASKTFRSDNVEIFRISLLFNELWNAEKMDSATLNRIAPDCGTLHVNMMQHVSTAWEVGHAVNSKGENVYLPNIHLLAQIPTLQQYGSESGVFGKEALVIDNRSLDEEAMKHNFVGPNGRSLHKYALASGHGHMDTTCGPTAYLTAFPEIVEHFEAWDSSEFRPWTDSAIDEK
jgi:cholesterol oxidase